MSFRYGTYYYSLIGHLIETDKFELSDDFFDKFIELLDKYGKTEDALLCVRKLIECNKKERFAL